MWNLSQAVLKNNKSSWTCDYFILQPHHVACFSAWQVIKKLELRKRGEERVEKG